MEEGAQAKECRQPLNAGSSQESSPLELQKELSPADTPQSEPSETVSGFLTSRTIRDLLKVTRLLVIYHSSNKDLVQGLIS